MPPKSAADVASLTFMPDVVWSPLPPFSGGAHAASAVMTSADAAVAARSRGVFMAYLPMGREAACSAPCRARVRQVNVTRNGAGLTAIGGNGPARSAIRLARSAPVERIFHAIHAETAHRNTGPTCLPPITVL